MEGFTRIDVKLKVAAGESCLVRTDMVYSRCWFYKSRACVIFNKVITDHKKCPECIEACK